MSAALVACVFAVTRRFDLFVSWEARAGLSAGLIVFLVGPSALQAWDYGRRSDRAARDVGRAGFLFAVCVLVVMLLAIV